MKTVLSICDLSGVWSQPYADAGFQVIRIDAGHDAGWSRIADNVWQLGCDILKTRWKPRGDVCGILAAPPCTCFCRPGARHWPMMDSTGQTSIDIAVWRECLRIIEIESPAMWAIENPPGRHQSLMPEIGDPAWQFHPWEYGDPWTKQTYIWGTAAKPETRTAQPYLWETAADLGIPVVDPLRSAKRAKNGKQLGHVARLSSLAKAQRSQTPAGFAAAFFAANNLENCTDGT